MMRLGRFISEDPAGFCGDGPNLYVYVLNNPVCFIDPHGKILIEINRAIRGAFATEMAKDTILNTTKALLIYIVWTLLLIFWGFLFHWLFGKEIGFFTALPTAILAYASAHVIQFIINKIGSSK